MARHFAVPQFFRQTPNKLLQRYFSHHGLFGDFDFAKIRERDTTKLVTGWDN